MMRQFLRPLVLRRSALVLLAMVLGSAFWATAQRRNPLMNPTGFDDVVSAISISPDSRTLAVARGAAEPSQRFGRIELWDTATGKLRRVIKGFDGPVKSIAFSPDGKTIVSGSLEYRSSKIQEKARSRDGIILGEIKWWDSSNGDLKHRVTMPNANTNVRVVYSPDGKDLVVERSSMAWSFTAGPAFQPAVPAILGAGTQNPMSMMMPRFFLNANMKVFDAQSGELKFKLNEGGSSGISYSPDGALIAVARGGDVKLSDSQTGKEAGKLKGFKGRPNALAFSPDGRILAVASTDFARERSGDYIRIIGISQIRLFDIATRCELRKVTEVGAVNTLAFSPSGRMLLMGGVMRQGERNIAGISLLDLETSKLNSLPTGEDFTEAVDFLALSKDGVLLAFRAGPTTVKVIDTSTWTARQTLDANSVGSNVERSVSRFILSVKRVLAVAFSVNGNAVTAETDQGEIKSWDPRTGEVKSQSSQEEDDPTTVVASKDGGSFAELSDGKVRFWSSGNPTKQLVPVPAGHTISALALSTDGQALALGGEKEVLIVSPTGSVSQTLAVGRPIASLGFSEDGGMLAAVADDGTIELWRLAEQKLERTIAAGAAVSALEFGPGGQVLATATADRDITLWSLRTGQPLAKLEKHNATVNALAFSRDGQFLASGSDDRTVVIWDTSSGKSKHTLKGQDQTVTSVAFSPDGQFLASGGGNASVIVWEVRTGRFSRVLR